MNIRALHARLAVVHVESFEYRRAYGTAKLWTLPDGWPVSR